jgi:glycosyltransferase involved in cell wall biosynthesis
MKKTIIYIGGFEFPDKNAAAQRALSVGKVFKVIGYNVVFIGISRDFSHSDDIDILHTRKECDGFETWSIPYPITKLDRLKYLLTPGGLQKIIKHLDTPIHSVVCYNYPAIAGYKVKNICKTCNAFFIPDVTEWYNSFGRGFVESSIKWFDTSLRMRVVNFFADGLITTSPYLTSFYRSKSSNIVELPTLYDKEMLRKGGTFTHKDNKIRKILYAGNPFSPYTNKSNKLGVKDRLDKVIFLLGRVIKENFVLNIYGVDKNRYLEVYPEHRDLLDRLNKKIIFNGKRPYLEIISNIKDSDFTIFFRDIFRVTKAGFPSKYSESITCGTPVITNLISNIEPYAIQGRNTFLVDIDNDVNSLSNMENILTLSDADLEKTKEFCIQSNTFDYKKYSERVENFIKGVENGRQ